MNRTQKSEEMAEQVQRDEMRIGETAELIV